MGKSPKSTEEKMNRMLNAWEELATDKSFGGITLAQFRDIAKPCQQSRERIAVLEAQRTQTISDREDADLIFEEKAQQVVNGVLADPNFGPDSALYEAFGYTPRRERRSGLTRKGKQGSNNS